MSKNWKEMERVVAKKLGRWWNCQFRRTPSSGAWSKNSRKGSAADDFHGDIVPPPEANFPFSVECKAYVEVELYKALYGKSNVFDWWLQCKQDALRCGKLSMLVMRENNKHNYLVAISASAYAALYDCLGASVVRMELHFTPQLPNGRKSCIQHLYIFDLDEFIKTLPKNSVIDLLT